MKIILDKSGTPDNFANLLALLDADAEVGGILILTCDENGFTPENVNGYLQATIKPVLGGVFPQILHGAEHLNRGTIAVGLPSIPRLALIEDVSQGNKDWDGVLTSAIPEASCAKAKTMLVFVDGFSSRISAVINALFNNFGLDINYLGGGGGSLTLVQKPCIISNCGLLQDAVVIAMLDMPSGVGVAHGWRPISDAFKVTEATGNIVHSLDWKPAYQVYKEVVEGHSGKFFDADNFFSMAKAYPFGITRLGAEMVVRDPLMTRGDSLVCVGEVHQGSFVRVMNGDQSSLIAAASMARDLAIKDKGSQAEHAEMFIDCVSRVLFLEDNFDLELVAVRDKRLPLFGALTIGEIANNGNDYLEFYNKTAVVGLF